MIRGRIVHGYGFESYGDAVQKVEKLKGGAVKASAVDAVKPLPTPNRAAYIYEISDSRDVRALEIYAYELLDHFVGAPGAVYFEIPDGKLIDVIRDPILGEYAQELEEEFREFEENSCPELKVIESAARRAGLRWPTSPISPLPKRPFLPSYATALMRGRIKGTGAQIELKDTVYEKGKTYIAVDASRKAIRKIAFSLMEIIEDLPTYYPCRELMVAGDLLWASLPLSLSDRVVFNYLKLGLIERFGYGAIDAIRHFKKIGEKALYGSPEETAAALLLLWLYPIEVPSRFVLSVPNAGGLAVWTVPASASPKSTVMRMSWPEIAANAAYDAIFNAIYSAAGPNADSLLKAMGRLESELIEQFCWRYGSMYSFPCVLLGTPLAPLIKEDSSLASVLEFMFGSRCYRAVVGSLSAACRKEECSEERVWSVFREMKSEMELVPADYSRGELMSTLWECGEKYVEALDATLGSTSVPEGIARKIVGEFEEKLKKAAEATAREFSGKQTKVTFYVPMD